MHIYKNKRFARFADKEGINDQKLCEAVRAVEQGIVNADLGGALSSSGWRGPAAENREVIERLFFIARRILPSLCTDSPRATVKTLPVRSARLQ